MTTVVYRDGVLASDSLSTAGNMRCGEVEKIRHVGDWAIGFAGEVRVGAEWLEWLQGVIERKEKFGRVPKDIMYGDESTSIDGLAVNKKGELWCWNGIAFPHKVKAQFYAIGSGSNFALGAMEMGADAKKAVQVGIKHDCYSGGTVREIKLR